MNVSVIGTGSWGTALAVILKENGHDVRCWTKEESVIEDYNKNLKNSKYLKDIDLPKGMLFTSDFPESVKGAQLLINAVPSQVTREVLQNISPFCPQNVVWATVSKGIENETFLRVSQIIEQVASVSQDKIVALSGPSHAEEVAKKIPTVVVAASKNLDSAKFVQDAFMNQYFRVYSNSDITGVELGGALKNIIALAAGICDGAGFGDNTKAALMTRGLVEMNRLGIQMGAQSDTFAGLSGMGDLIVTCMSRHSRNRHVGEQIGKGRSLEEVLNEMVMVAEGVKTAKSVHFLAEKYNAEMPISEQVYQVLFENKSPHDALYDLMTRASKNEDWS